MKKLIGVVLGVVVLALAGAVVFSSQIVQAAVEKVGSRALGVPVTLENANVGFLSGSFKLQGLKVANLSGFEKDRALSFREVEIQVEPKSLMSNKIVVNKIVVRAPEVFYEGNLKTNNFKEFKKYLEHQKSRSEVSAPKSSKAERSVASTSAPSQQKVQIDYVLIEQAAMHALLKTPVAEREFNLQLPKVEIEGIGNQKEGVDVQQALQTILQPFVMQIEAVALKKIEGEGMNGVLEKLKQKSGPMLDNIRNLF